MPNPYEVAAWRFFQIAPLIDPSLDAVLRRAALRECTTKPVLRPWDDATERHGKKPSVKPLSRSTLYRWRADYLEHGYTGLLPKRRNDRGQARNAGTAAWIGYAIGLLYEQPHRSLMQLEIYLRIEFGDYSLSTSTLRRHLHAHPAYAGVEKLRSGKKSKLRDLYEAEYPHEGWQLDGKGPFVVYLIDGTRIRVHVLTILDAEIACLGPSFQESVRSFGALNNRLLEFSQQAHELIVNHDYHGALRAATQAIDLDPHFAPAYHHRSCAHFHLGEVDDSLAQAAVALQLDPHDRQVILHCGDLLQRQGHPGQAQALYRFFLLNQSAYDSEVIERLKELGIHSSGAGLDRILSACARLGI